MAKCRVSFQAALAYLQSIRPIVDVSQRAKEDYEAQLSVDFYGRNQNNLWNLFPSAGVATFDLPLTIWPEVFKLLIQGPIWKVPEHVVAWTQVSARVAPAVALEPTRTSPASGSADGGNVSRVQAGADYEQQKNTNKYTKQKH